MEMRKNELVLKSCPLSQQLEYLKDLQRSFITVLTKHFESEPNQDNEDQKDYYIFATVLKDINECIANSERVTQWSEISTESIEEMNLSYEPHG